MIDIVYLLYGILGFCCVISTISVFAICDFVLPCLFLFASICGCLSLAIERDAVREWQYGKDYVVNYKRKELQDRIESKEKEYRELPYAIDKLKSELNELISKKKN